MHPRCSKEMLPQMRAAAARAVRRCARQRRRWDVTLRRSAAMKPAPTRRKRRTALLARSVHASGSPRDEAQPPAIIHHRSRAERRRQGIQPKCLPVRAQIWCRRHEPIRRRGGGAEQMPREGKRRTGNAAPAEARASIRAQRYMRMRYAAIVCFSGEACAYFAAAVRSPIEPP